MTSSQANNSAGKDSAPVAPAREIIIADGDNESERAQMITVQCWLALSRLTWDGKLGRRD